MIELPNVRVTLRAGPGAGTSRSVFAASTGPRPPPAAFNNSRANTWLRLLTFSPCSVRYALSRVRAAWTLPTVLPAEAIRFGTIALQASGEI